MRQLLVNLTVVVTILFVAFEASEKFDRQLVELKLKHFSDQRNWSFAFSQEHVYSSATFRYKADLEAFERLVHVGSSVLSDKATSYHLASTLPVYIVNVHQHQGRWMRRSWTRFIDDGYFCYPEFAENRARIFSHLAAHNDVQYVVVNNDPETRHRSRDCLSFRSESLRAELPEFLTLIHAGEYLDLYHIH